MNHRISWLILRLAALILLASNSMVTFADGPISPDRIRQVTGMLPEQPGGFGTPCSDREAWIPLAQRFANQVSQASSDLQKPLPLWDNDAYLEFTRSGDRARGEKMLSSRQGLLSPLVLAECVEGRGRFLPRIAELLDSLSAQKSWTYPAHDPKLDSSSGRRQFVELNSAQLANAVAETLYLLGNRLPSSTRKNAIDALEYHVFSPMRQAYATGTGEEWFQMQSNWNPVCLNGVTGAALAVIQDPRDRALFVAGAEHYYTNYLAGFPKDGYAVEGIGYWNYGLTAFSELRERIWQSTDGRLDLFQDPHVRQIALFGLQFQMLPDVAADFGDAPYKQQPSHQLVAYIEDVFRLVDPATHTTPDPAKLPPSGDLIFDVMVSFPIRSQLSPSASEGETSRSLALRTYYPISKVLVCRPINFGRLAIAIKAGGNTTHSHNDIGSFVIGQGHFQMLGDPGGPNFYTAATFSSQRLDSPLLNSFGHPVPVIGGHLQLDATKVNASVIATSFRPDADSITFDITSAYDEPRLRRLERTMVYSRVGSGSIDIVDKFDLTSPVDVEEALPTHGTWTQLDPKTIEFKMQDQRLDATIEAPYPIVIEAKQLTDYGNSFTRVAIIIKMQSSGTVSMRFSPEP
jgi:hypothetical protein